MPRSSKISIIYIIAEHHITGAPRHLLELIRHIDRNKFIVSAILPEGPLAKALKALKVPVFTVPMRGRADLSAIAAIKKILTKYEPDIVHTHGQRAGVLGRLAVKGMHFKVIHTEHTYTHHFKLDNPLLHWTHLRAMQTLGWFTHRTIAVSDAVRIFLTSARISKPDKVVTIYNGIVSTKPKLSASVIQEFRQSHALSASDQIIGTVGALNSQKGTSTLISAFAQVHTKWPKLKLVIVGGGELRKSLEQLADKLGISSKVVFAGHVSDIEPALANLQLFVLPSRSEAFGLSLLEAMRFGVPIIASRVGGIPEIIVHNHNGILVEHDAPKKLATAISKLLNDKKLQKKIVANYPATLKKFTITKMVKATEDLYRQVME